MHKNYFWLCFLSLITGAVGWITIKTLYAIYLYLSLDATAQSDKINWSIEQLKEDRFVMKANYSFQANGQKYAGETVFKNDFYWNPWAAEDALKVYDQKDWTVWYSSKNPTYSSLEKNFPLKESISTFVLWLILIYFLGLGYYVVTKKS